MPVGVLTLANLLLREGLAVKGINYAAELIRNWAFWLRPLLSAQRGIKLVIVALRRL
jgi:hypothetical protein